MRTRILNSTKLQFIVILLFSFLAYSNIFQNQFLGDDKNYLENWQTIREIKNIPQLFLGHEFLGTPRYRPIGSTFLVLYYQLFGENPFGYHVVSLSIHLISTILIYAIALEICKRKIIAFIASLLFGIHPINIEVVGFMISSINIGYAFFLASFFFYIQFRNSNQERFKWASLFFASCAAFSYELTLTLPLIIILYDLCFRKLNLKKFTSNLSIYSFYFLVTFLYLFIRYFLLHIYDRITHLEGSFYLTMLVMVKVITKIISLLILPINLSINPIIPPGIQSLLNPYTIALNKDKILSQKISDVDVLLGLILILSLIIIAYKNFAKKPIITFCIGWFFITLLPVANILPQTTIFQERYVYLPSFGYAFLLGYILHALYRLENQLVFKKVKNMLIIFLVIILTLGYSLRTYLRNNDWRNEITMWSRLASQIPYDAATNFHLANLYAQDNQHELATQYYQKIVNINPNIAESYGKLGQVYLKQGKADLALKNFSQALSLYPDFISAREVIESLTNFKSKPSLQVTRADGVWKMYVNDSLLFFYPEGWQVEEKQGGVEIIDTNDNFVVSIRLDSLNQSYQDYLASQQEQYGILENQGLAAIPTFEKAYVKIWKDKQLQKIQFFLFGKNTALKILVYPGDSAQMKVFDQIIQSMIVTN